MKLTQKEQQARKMSCLALDNIRNKGGLKSRVKELSPIVGLVKIGNGVFTKFGTDAVKIVQDYGVDVFLDLKYHDIPDTVKEAAEGASRLGVYMFTIHASGGSEMMKAAVEGAKYGAGDSGLEIPKIVGVSVLTSIDDYILKEELKVSYNVKHHVDHLASLSYDSGLDGIVCSAADLGYLKKYPKPFVYVTPGIKHPNTGKIRKNHKRIFTPAEAVEAGASLLVIGGAITDYDSAEERVQAGYEILRDIARVL